MRKRLLLNGVPGRRRARDRRRRSFATVRSSSSSAATTQTVATAKRGVVLQSVTSTGNVEAPTNLSLSFQQSGEVTAIFVKPGDHVIAGQALAQVDDTQQKHALASAQASLDVGAGEPRRRCERGETAIERESDDAVGRVRPRSRSRPREQGLTHAQQTPGEQRDKYQQAVDQAQASLTQRQRRRGDRADRTSTRRTSR